MAVWKIAELARADSRRVPSVFKRKLLRFNDGGRANNEFRSGYKEEDGVEHPRERENCVGEECELVGGMHWVIYTAAESEPSRYGVGYDSKNVDKWITDGNNNVR